MNKNHPEKIDQEEAIYERCAGIDVQLTSIRFQKCENPALCGVLNLY